MDIAPSRCRSVRRSLVLLLLFSATPMLFSQGALLLEQPYGVFGTLNPTGHAALYLEHVCADSPIHLRPCGPGETGVVISRYKGIARYDWLAIPLIPYLYAVDDPASVPAQVNEEMVAAMRSRYRETHLETLGDKLPPGNFFNGGWTELVGTAYDRRTYAFRFATTPEQDREVMDRLNDSANHSHFNILFNNCADFDRSILNVYFPHVFGRTVFPDAGITTPKRIAYALTKYSRRHADGQFAILEIPQVPGNRRQSHAVHGVAESLVTNGYVIPVVVLNPYIAGGVLADYLIQGRYKLIPKNPPTVDSQHLDALVAPQGSPSATVVRRGATLTETNPQRDNPSVRVQAVDEAPKSSAPSSANF